jgi:hypothetical protein
LIISPLDADDDGRMISLPSKGSSSSGFDGHGVATAANSFGSAFVYQLDYPLAKKRFIQWYVHFS